MKYFLGVITLTLIIVTSITLTSPLSKELEWEFGYREDKLSAKKFPVAGADFSLGEGNNNYVEISIQCEARMSPNPVYFEILRISNDVNACRDTGYFTNPFGFINYKYRVDNGPLLDGGQRPEYCNELKIPVWLSGGGEPSSNFPATLFRAERLRIEVTLAHGEQPVIDISMRDAAIQRFVSACEALTEALEKSTPVPPARR